MNNSAVIARVKANFKHIWRNRKRVICHDALPVWWHFGIEAWKCNYSCVWGFPLCYWRIGAGWVGRGVFVQIIQAAKSTKHIGAEVKFAVWPLRFCSVRCVIALVLSGTGTGLILSLERFTISPVRRPAKHQLSLDPSEHFVEKGNSIGKLSDSIEIIPAFI